MDCDDALLLFARQGATLTGVESAQLANHVAGCESCRRLARASVVVVAEIDADALDDPDRLALPTVDPSMFDIEGAIGAGGMGRVVRARDRRLGRTIAIKEVTSEVHRARLEREAQITARLQHPAIVPIYEAGNWPDGSVFYTMRLVEGQTLARELRRCEGVDQRLALLPAFIAVVEAIAYAHAEGVIHRDIKPQNVLCGPFGETVVIDWGLAKRIGDNDNGGGGGVDPREARPGDLTRAGAVVGTPSFMAPEQARGEPADARADVYALGAVLYTLLAGSPPYWDTHAGGSGDDVVAAVVAGPPTPIRELASAPADLFAITERAMAREPAERYADAGPMAAELRRFEAGRLLETRDYSLGERLRRWVARHRALVAVSAAALAAIAVIATLAIRSVIASRDLERGARVRAEAERAELIFQQARAALEVDPTAAIAWLKRYPAGAPRSSAAALIAREAPGRGVAWRVFDAPATDIDVLELIDGDRLVAGPPFRSWELATGVAIDHDPVSGFGIAAAHDPVGDRLFIRAGDAIVTQSMKTGQTVATYQAPAKIESVAFALDRERQAIAIGLKSGALILWNVATGERRSVELGEPIRGVEIVGHHAVVRTGKAIWRVALAGGEPAAFDVDPRIWFPALGNFVAGRLPGATRFVVRSSRGLWLGSTELMSMARLEIPAAMYVGVSGDQRRVIASADDGEVAIYDLETAKELDRVRITGGDVSEVGLDGAGERAVVRTAGSLLFIESGEATALQPSKQPSGIAAFDLAGDGGRLAAVGGDGLIRVYELARLDRTFEPPSDLPLGTCGDDCVPIGSWATTGGAVVICRGGDDRRVSARRLELDGAVTAIDLPMADDIDMHFLPSADGSSVFTEVEKAIDVWRDGRHHRVPVDPVTGTTVATDGLSVIHPAPGRIEQWSVETGAVIHSWPVAATTSTMSPDGALVLADLADGLAIVDRAGAVIDRNPLHQLYPSRAVWALDSSAVAVPIALTGWLLYRRDQRRWRRVDLGPIPRRFSGKAWLSSGGRVLLEWSGNSAVLHDVDAAVSWRFDAPGLYGGVVGDQSFELLLERGRARVPLPRFEPAGLGSITNAVIDEDGKVGHEIGAARH